MVRSLPATSSVRMLRGTSWGPRTPCPAAGGFEHTIHWNIQHIILSLAVLVVWKVLPAITANSAVDPLRTPLLKRLIHSEGNGDDNQSRCPSSDPLFRVVIRPGKTISKNRNESIQQRRTRAMLSPTDRPPLRGVLAAGSRAGVERGQQEGVSGVLLHIFIRSPQTRIPDPSVRRL